MTSPKLGLLPASSDDRFALLAALELASSGVLQFGQVVGAEVGQGVSLEPGSSDICTAPSVLSRYSRTARLLCCAVPSHTIISFRLSCARSALRNSTISALLIAPSCRRNRKFVRVRHYYALDAISQTDSFEQSLPAVYEALCRTRLSRPISSQFAVYDVWANRGKGAESDHKKVRRRRSSYSTRYRRQRTNFADDLRRN